MNNTLDHLTGTEDGVDETPVTMSISDERKSKDLELFHKWKTSGSKKDLGVLVHHLAPIIYKEVSRASGSLPTVALNAEAKNWTIKAIQTFEPERGFALSTHVMNYLPKVRRMNYKYQNAVRLPENMQLQFHDYNKSLGQLTDELNRDPTEEEMAQKLGWSKGQVVKFKGSLYSDLIEGGGEKDLEFTQFSDHPIMMKYLLEQLTPEEKTILQLNKTISSPELAARLGVNINGLNYRKDKLTQKIMKLKQELGI